MTTARSAPTQPAPDAPETALPPLTLVLGPAGAGKTEAIFARFLQHDRPALLIASSPPQAETYAEQIAARAGKPVADARGAIMPLHSLVSAINKSAPASGFRFIERPLQRLALTEIFQEAIHPDDFLGRMRDAPGFIGALAERLREWKLAYATPDTLEAGALAAAETLEDPAFPLKTRELARLFRAYESFLAQNRLQDEEDGLRLAAERIASGAASLPNKSSLLLVDGFYRFTRAQRALLAAIAGRGLDIGKPETEVIVTLPYDAARALLFAAPERTLETLRAEFAVHEKTLPARPESRPPALRLLERRLFAPPGEEGIRVFGYSGIQENAEPISSNADTPEHLNTRTPEYLNTHSPDRLLIFDAPNPYVEAEMVAREFRRARSAEGLAWSDFAVVLRSMGDYAPILSAVFERYDVPLGVDGPEILTENPLLKTVLHLLAVVRDGWKRDDVLAFLKSSYTVPDKLAADALRRRARSAGVREGRERWLSLVQDDAGGEGTVAATLQEMAYYDGLLTEERAEFSDFAEWVREIIVSFALEERIELGEQARRERDRAALTEGLDVLAALAQMAQMAQRGPVMFAQFHDALRAAWQSASSIAPTSGDRVRVTEPYNAREAPLKVAAVMGLTERVFPRRVTEDPFLRDEERTALRQAVGLDLEEQRNRADDERLFFYLAVTAPSERLILSFPRSADESDTLPSFYLDEVRAVFETEAGSPSLAPYIVSRTLADVAPRPEEVVSESDILLAACADLFDPGSESDPAERARRRRRAAEQMQRCLEDATQSEVAREVVASRRLPRLPRLTDKRLRQDFAGGADRIYGVSELEAYRRCPFQYFLRHTLTLHPEEEGTAARAQGELLHGILRRYFRRRHARKPEPPTPDLETMRGELRELLDESLQNERLDASPHRLRMLQRHLTDSLEGFAEREHRLAPLFGMTPAHFELAFGFGAGGTAFLEDEDRLTEEGFAAEGNTMAAVHDPASCAEPLLLLASDGGPSVAVCGTIDRVDYDASGRRALALDYKLGKPPEYSAILRGESLQLPLYLLAIERLFGAAGAVACYDSMQERSRPRFFRTEHVNPRQFQPVTPMESGETVKPLNRQQYADLTRTAEATAVQVARDIASGRVEATPGDHCRVCPYNDVCRTTRTGEHDGEFVSLSARPSAPPAAEA